MADVAHSSHSRPRAIPTLTPNLAPPRHSSHLTLETSPVTQYGSYEFDRIVKSGQVLKRTRKTKSWKTVFIVLRPHLLSIYKDADESRLRHQVQLSELTAVARQRDPKRRDKHVFGLFSPSRNFHLEALSDKEAHEWVELIRQGAGMDTKEDEMVLASPGGAESSYVGFERSIDAHISPWNDERNAAGYSSSDAEAFHKQPISSKTRQNRTSQIGQGQRQASKTSAADYYSGVEHGSMSDFSDSGLTAAARMSALSLSTPDARPTTAGTMPPPPAPGHSVYGSRPSIGQRDASQLSALGMPSPDEVRTKPSASDERVINHGWIHLLKSKSGVRQWKKVWMVLRPKGLAIYKNEEEYSALVVLPFSTIIDAVEIDPISKSKRECMQIISEERNYRFCAFDEESLARWLGAFKSLLEKRKASKAAAASGGVGSLAG
ncbi:unnamed protein product [Zymoseptoria tritici ST99CH_1A5]|uniref:PH domain-containing protein n=3 Tax=Zymoseptoria tritici TaxID=1047171 RepID=A0A1X7RKN7_ZYMT9|nr:unnamed protein product [Zymoseptoria tritici ST99CH_3D7]SMR46538.1 unnamed protein product [Zymoseptoria tritici ST99CH_1E4]SMR47781.1 unnamed protein product [Zymoseptoria tritici ST99CH_3D1]SMY21684.1 unnamed protein product [Zymoseptoria tritici ST99CH_1A5]